MKYPSIPERIYKKDISPFIGEIAVDQVTPPDIRQCIQSIAKSDRPSIANDAILCCKQLFRHGVELNLLHYNPAEAFTVSDAGGVEKSRSRCLSIDEVESLFESFHENSDQFIRENDSSLISSLG